MAKLKDMIPGGKGDKMTVEKIAEKHGVSVEHIKKQFDMGVKVEREHSKIPEEAKEIALDHLTENPNYYTKLKSAGLADELKESKVGDVYISIGEAIEEIESGYKKLEKLIKPMNLKPGSRENQNLYKLRHSLIDLKTMFSDSYDFKDTKSGGLTKLDVIKLIDYLDSLASFSIYRDRRAEYDDTFYYDIPYTLLDKYGLTKKVLDKINSNTEDYHGNIGFDDKKKMVHITGGDY